MTLRFTVYGSPAPQGSKRVVSAGRGSGGRAVLVESSAAVKPWRQAVCYAAREAMMELSTSDVQPNVWLFPMTGPISATMVFTLLRPASAPKKRLWPDRKPDIDKLSRSTFDALRDAGLIEDDARIVRLEAWKIFSRPWGFPRSTDQEVMIFDRQLRLFELDTPGAVIEIRSL